MPEIRTARILLVEDDLPLRRAMRRGLERCGHTVEVAADGLEGWQLIEAADPPYDLVISDSRMPRMPGRVLMAMILERCPATRVLRISGEAGRDPGPEGVASLDKPFSLVELSRAVERVLR